MSFKHSQTQKSPFFLKRIQYFLSRIVGTRLQKAKSLHIVTVNGQRYKRLILCDSYLASEIESHLDHFAPSEYFPPLVSRYEHEIWLEYIEGLPISQVDEEIVQKIAAFYGSLYISNPQLQDTTQSSFLPRLLQDLRFLNQISILPQASYLDLKAAIPDLTPKQLWVGYEYTDPVLKNFVLRSGDKRLCVIDVDGLAKDQLLGIGIAKAAVRWLGSYQQMFFKHLFQPAVPNFQEYFSFIELCFLAKWTIRAYMEQKWKNIDPTHFDRFRRPS